MKTLAMLLVLACGGGEEAAAPPSTEPAASAISEGTRASVGEALTAYETIRDRLADDTLEGVPAAGSTLAQAATAAREGAPPALRAHLDTIASSGRSLSGTGDLEAARAAFGEASRGIVGLLSEAPSLAEGYHVFHCPMAEGYQKWVQADATLENPYMGQQMLTCGTESEWEI